MSRFTLTFSEHPNLSESDVSSDVFANIGVWCCWALLCHTHTEANEDVGLLGGRAGSRTSHSVTQSARNTRQSRRCSTWGCGSVGVLGHNIAMLGNHYASFILFALLHPPRPSLEAAMHSMS